MKRVFPMVIPAKGEAYVPKFPVVLHPGDELLLVREGKGWRAPNGNNWLVSGYSDRGPVVTRATKSKKSKIKRLIVTGPDKKVVFDQIIDSEVSNALEFKTPVFVSGIVLTDLPEGVSKSEGQHSKGLAGETDRPDAPG